MSLQTLADAIVVPPPCTFIIGDDSDQLFTGWFLGFWSPSYANVRVSSQTMVALRALDLGDDFGMAAQRADGHWNLVGSWTITLVRLHLSPTEAAAFLKAAIA